MKKLDYIILVIFSVLILVASILVILLSLGWLDFAVASKILERAIQGAKTSKVVLGTSIFLAILAIKGIFFVSNDKEKDGTSSGILMENESGKLMISKQTLENLVSSVVKEFENAEEVKTLIKSDENNNLFVYVNIVVRKDVIIKELTVNIQNKIKEAIKKTSDLDVKEVNVKIRNIASSDKENK